jgi:AraC-like DNA-binding protein
MISLLHFGLLLPQFAFWKRIGVKTGLMGCMQMQIRWDSTHPNAVRIEPDAHFPFVREVAWADLSQITSPGYETAQHLHHFHQLDVILDGEFKLILEDGSIETGRPGDAWIIPPLVWHGVRCAQPFYYCSFKFHLTPRFWPLFGTAFHRFTVSSLLRQSIQVMVARCKKTEKFESQQMAAVISLCLIEFLDQVPQNTDTSDNLDEFRHLLWPLLEKIQENPNIDWSVRRMARELNLSVNYFSRCFRRIAGQTPQRYVLESTMRASAARLLEIPSHSIKEIAEHAGYASVHAFTRAFSQVFKTSPAAYRRQANINSE